MKVYEVKTLDRVIVDRECVYYIPAKNYTEAKEEFLDNPHIYDRDVINETDQDYLDDTVILSIDESYEED